MDIRKCVVCGKDFMPNAGMRKCCSDECSRIRTSEQSREHKRKIRQGIIKPKTRKKAKKKTDWKAIGKLMKESGLTYGQLQARGMLEGMEVDKR